MADGRALGASLAKNYIIVRRVFPNQGCAPEFIPETHTQQKYPTFVKWTGITRTPDTHLSWVGYIPIPTHIRVLDGYGLGVFQVKNTLICPLFSLKKTIIVADCALVTPFTARAKEIQRMNSSELAALW